MTLYKNIWLKMCFAPLLIMAVAPHIGAQEPEPISSLCQEDNNRKLKCEDDRECVFKFRVSIQNFFTTYEAPMPISMSPARYPQKCLHRSHKEEVVNLTYDVLPNGEPTNLNVLNSSNNCFDRAARNSIRKLRFKETSKGHICVPWTVRFPRETLSDAAGRRF